MKRLPLVRLLLFLGSLTGCAVGPDYQMPRLQLPAQFAASPASEAKALVDPARWWKWLGDKRLDALVEQSVSANLDLQIALTRLQSVQEGEALTMGKALPALGAAGAAGQGSGSDVTRGRVPSLLTSADDSSQAARIHQLAGFDLDADLDFFGRNRRAIEAAAADTAAAAEARNAVLVGIIAEMVRAYVDLRGFQSQLAVLDQDIRLAGESRDFVKIRFERGLTNELDLTLAEREVSVLTARKAPLEAERDASLSAIALLIGRSRGELPKDLAVAQPLPTLPNSVDPGQPLTLLRRRPDLRQAERQLAASTARIGVAISALFPQVNLGASGGAQFSRIGPAGAQSIWSFGPSVTWPLLDFGTIDAQIAIATLKSKEDLLRYRRVVVTAIRDVDIASANFAAQQDRLADLGAALSQAERAVALAKQRYERGLTDFLNVVDAERQEYVLEADLVATQQAAAEQFVALYLSLGGGWEHYQTIPPVPAPHPALVALFEHM
jgi:NodT family efflux transporter outer membrane factor (OMF) lipoprotein